MSRVNLLVDYVGLKLAKSTPAQLEKRNKIGREQYRAIIADCSTNIIKEDLEHIAQTLRQRFGWKEHACLFLQPTIGQWCRDLMGQYTPEDILELLSQETGLRVSYLKQSRIGGGAIDWPYLFDLVASIEKVTGRPSIILKDYSGFTVSEDSSFQDLAKAIAYA